MANAHPLKKWLEASKQTEAQFAASVGTTASYVSNLINGHRYPSRRMAQALSAATGGFVTAADLLLHSPEAVEAPDSPSTDGKAA